jgi:hypothetical protein
MAGSESEEVEKEKVKKEKKPKNKLTQSEVKLTNKRSQKEA